MLFNSSRYGTDADDKPRFVYPEPSDLSCDIIKYLSDYLMCKAPSQQSYRCRLKCTLEFENEFLPFTHRVILEKMLFVRRRRYIVSLVKNIGIEKCERRNFVSQYRDITSHRVGKIIVLLS